MEAAGKERNVRASRVLRTLPWAVLIPLTAVAGTFLGLLLWIWVGALFTCLAAALAAIAAGGIWNRAGAAVIAATATLGLGLFSGSVLHETYAKLFGEQINAVVVDTADGENFRGRALRVCRVVDTTGTVQDLDNTRNCGDGFEPGQRVILFEDPLGALDPWLEATGERSLDPAAPSALGALFAASAGSLLYAGARRRSNEEMDARKRRKYGPPRRSES